LVLLATIVIWAHGCHGEEDNELGILFGPRRQRPVRLSEPLTPLRGSERPSGY